MDTGGTPRIPAPTRTREIDRICPMACNSGVPRSSSHASLAPPCYRTRASASLGVGRPLRTSTQSAARPDGTPAVRTHAWVPVRMGPNMIALASRKEERLRARLSIDGFHRPRGRHELAYAVRSCITDSAALWRRSRALSETRSPVPAGETTTRATRCDVGDVAAPGSPSSLHWPRVVRDGVAATQRDRLAGRARGLRLHGLAAGER